MKTIKSYLKQLLIIANIDRNDLVGISKLTKDEYLVLGEIRADIQNSLGENSDLLKKYGLEYND